jgi:hypothetical protein
MSSEYLIIVLDYFNSTGDEIEKDVYITRIGEGINIWKSSSIVIYTPSSIGVSDEFCKNYLDILDDMRKIEDSNPHRFDDYAEMRHGNCDEKIKDFNKFILSKI